MSTKVKKTKSRVSKSRSTEPKQKSVVLMQGVFEKGIYDQLKKKRVKDAFILEGRPTLRAAKETSKELLKNSVQPILISDNMAGFLFAKNMVKEVWLSYKIADKNGAVCEIGGLILAVLCKRHKVPVYLYPSSGQLKLMGDQKEIFYFNGERTAPQNVRGYVPLVEWVPKKYIKKVFK